MNLVKLQAVLLEKKEMRYTPAGMPITEALCFHQSEQSEAGTFRKVECEVPVLAVGAEALLLAQASIGQSLKLSGFLDAKSLKYRQLWLHLNTIELVKGS